LLSARSDCGSHSPLHGNKERLGNGTQGGCSEAGCGKHEKGQILTLELLKNTAVRLPLGHRTFN
ncbi:hypothetical protein ILYODFUR_032042, partial [Ilyodon furcidens]